jgi:hypothetical protein
VSSELVSGPGASTAGSGNPLSRLLAAGFSWWLVLLVAVAFAVGALAAHFGWQQTIVQAPPVPVSDVPPGEYLYLDSGRVVAYLSQLEDGLSSSELRTLSQTRSLSAGIGGSFPLQAQGTSQTQSSLQETVTPTAASLFYRLERKLREQHWLKTLNASATRPGQLRRGVVRLEEGSFVRIANVRIGLPADARIYPAFARRAPALPLAVKLTLGGQRIDLLFPIAYGRLANEPSLFSTRLTVLGKIVRQLDPGERAYVDRGTELAFARLLAKNDAALRTLGLSAPRLEAAFTKAVTVRGPGAVVLPVAIFK